MVLSVKILPFVLYISDIDSLVCEDRTIALNSHTDDGRNEVRNYNIL